MNNLPTLKEVVSFLKDYKKIILGTMVACLLLYALGMGYTIYSNSKVEERGIPVDENIDSSQEVLTPEEIKNLQEDLVSFSFYIENDSAEQFTNYNLMKQLLISPETLAYIEEKSGREIEPSPFHAVNMSLDHDTYVLTLSIGTGNYNDNKAIAQAYYEGIVNGEIPFFSTNKNVYEVSQPAKSNIEEVMPTNGENTNTENESVSLTTIAALAIAVIIGSFVLGVFIALIYAMNRKVITDPFSYAQRDDDVILNLSPLAGSMPGETGIETIEHAIMHPKKKTKVILSEQLLPSELITKLTDSFSPLNEYNAVSTDIDNSYASIFNDLTKVNPLLPVEEVVIICEKDKTTKNWYNRQRSLLKNYQADIKIIQI